MFSWMLVPLFNAAGHAYAPHNQSPSCAHHVVNAAKRKRELAVEDQKLDYRQHSRIQTGAPAVSHDSSASGGAVQSRRRRLVISIHWRTSSDRANIVRNPDRGPSPRNWGPQEGCCVKISREGCRGV